MTQIRAHFLVVDDDPNIRHQVRDMLEGCGQVGVLTVTDGEHALDILREVGDIGCIITGTKMSNLGGLGLIEVIRKNDQWRRLPVLVMIEPGDEATITLAASLGASGYIEKPIRIEILRKKLAFILAPRPTEGVK